MLAIYKRLLFVFLVWTFKLVMLVIDLPLFFHQPSLQNFLFWVFLFSKIEGINKDK